MGVRLKQSPTADSEKRADPTYAEEKMWEILRKLRRPNVHFRRQGRVGSFAVDFVCRTARLVIEVDGGIHRIKQAQDTRRQAVIEAAGYTVLRFTNEEAIKNPVGVRTKVLAALNDLGFPHP